tara:strand:+ start:1186 stop:1383 length:198 start_codon:yes stop_codon:yes gene_type:complete
MANEKKKKKTKKKIDTNRNKLLSTIPGVFYKGSGKDPAVKELLKILKREGADSIKYSWPNTRWKV